MTRVFVVTSSDYEEYRVGGVFSTESRAKAFVAILTLDSSAYEIVEWQMDKLPPAYEGLYRYVCSVRTDGECCFVRQDDEEWDVDNAGRFRYPADIEYFITYVLAKDAADAKRIARERYALAKDRQGRRRND